jgi:hypothetical protein
MGVQLTEKPHPFLQPRHPVGPPHHGDLFGIVALDDLLNGIPLNAPARAQGDTIWAAKEVRFKTPTWKNYSKRSSFSIDRSLLGQSGRLHLPTSQ